MTHFFSRGRIWQALGNDRQRGFSLVEIALVLVIIGLALGGIIAAMGPQLENKKVSDTQTRIKEASDAIMAYAMVNRRLPCPATAASNGDEVLVGTRGQCANPNNGFVPARTLGLGGRGANGLTQDPWSFGLRYAVSQVTYTGATNFDFPPPPICAPGPAATCYPLTQINGIRNAFYDGATSPRTLVSPTAAPSNLSLAGLEALRICNSSTGITATTCGPAANQLASAAFIVWSTGRNGTVASGADEAANLNNDVVYVFHPRTEPGGAGGGLDDLFQWQTVNAIISKMSDGGVLR